MSKNKIKNNVFIRFFISYILILLISAVIGLFTYSICIDVIEEDAKEINSIVLEQGMDAIDRCLSEIDRTIVNLTLNYDIRRLIANTGENEAIIEYDILKMRNMLSNYIATNDLILDYFVYFKNINTIVLPHASYSNPQLFYQNYLTYEGTNYEEWKEKFLYAYHNREFMPASKIALEKDSKSIITYIQSIPYNSPQNPKGCVTFLINEKKIQDILSRLYIDRLGWFYIIDPKGKIITSSKPIEDLEPIDIKDKSSKGYKNIQINDEQMYVSYITSPNNGWRYVAVLPADVVMNKANRIKKVTWLVTGLLVLVGSFIANLLAYRNSKPLKEMVKTIKGFLNHEPNEDSGNEYDILKGALNSLISSNEDLQHSLKEQAPFLRAAVIDHLIRGGYSNPKELSAALSHNDITIRGKYFTIVLLQINVYDEKITRRMLNELDVERVIIKKIAEKILQDKGYIHDLQNNMIAVLLSFNIESKEDIKKDIEAMIKEINSEIEKNSQITVSVTAGGVYDNLLDIYKSFNEATSTLDYKLMKNQAEIIWYDQIPKESSEYYYPLELELRLRNLVKAASKDEIVKLLKELYEENFVNRNLPPDMLKQLIYEMKGTLIKIKGQVNIENNESIIDDRDLLIDLNKGRPFQYVYSRLQDIYITQCDLIEAQRKSHNEYLAQQIKTYIDSNYHDSELSLCKVSSEFRLNETYLSYFFKESTGENFSNYLEQLRIKKACELLVSTSATVSEVAKCVGYNSDQSFRRAFKRIKNMSPSAIRG